jgi:LuxR family transcriptional regulator
LSFEDTSCVVSHFQAMRYLSKSNSYEWFYSVKKKFDDNRIITISNPISTLGNMQKQVEKLLEENLFIRKNLSKLNSLTIREKEIIKLIFQGYSSKQIAEKLFISPHTVGTHRKNIKYKLKIKNYNELYKFALEFDLI